MGNNISVEKAQNCLNCHINKYNEDIPLLKIITTGKRDGNIICTKCLYDMITKKKERLKSIYRSQQ